MDEGDASLEDRLLNASLDLLADRPADRLSLRQVAQGLGVSHQAPYVHFGNKRRFLAAVAGTGLAQAVRAAEDALERAGPLPEHRLHALVDAYVGFIRERPHVHDLAYGPLVAKADHPLLQQGAIAYWTLLHDVVAACQPEGTNEQEVLRRATAAWGTVYGIARLAAMKQIPRSVPGDQLDLIHEALETLRLGWAAS